MIFVLNSNYKQLDSNLLDFIFDNCCYIAGNCCWPPPSQLADRQKTYVENIPTFNVFPLYLSVVNHVIFTLCILVHPCARLVLPQCRIFASSTISKMGAQQMEVMRDRLRLLMRVCEEVLTLLSAKYKTFTITIIKKYGIYFSYI